MPTNPEPIESALAETSAAAVARAQVGVPYRWSGTAPSDIGFMSGQFTIRISD